MLPLPRLLHLLRDYTPSFLPLGSFLVISKCHDSPTGPHAEMDPVLCILLCCLVILNNF